MHELQVIVYLTVIAMAHGETHCSTPDFNVSSSSTQQLVEGQTVSLFCDVGKGGLSSWRLFTEVKPRAICSGNECLPTSSFNGTYHISRNDSGMSLTIINLNRKRDGNIWVCELGRQQGCFDLKNITVPIRNVTISQGSSVTRGEVTGDSGSLQGFSCRPNTGSPKAIFHWRLIQATGTTTELVPNSTVHMNVTGDQELVTSVSSLQFVFNRSMNGASLECSATNNNITRPATDSVTLNVLYGPSTVTIQGTKPSYPLGSNVTGLTCVADCNPVCSFQWSNMGQVVKNASVLSIPRLTNKTAGMYTCMVVYNGTLTPLNTSVIVNVSATASKTPPSTPTKFPIIPVAAGAGGGVLVLVIIVVVVVVVVCKKKKRKAQVEAESVPVAEKKESTTGGLVYADLEMSAKQPGGRQKKKGKKKEEEHSVIHGDRSSIQYAEIMVSDKSRPP